MEALSESLTNIVTREVLEFIWVLNYICDSQGV